MRYSLADYILKVTLPESLSKILGLGGELAIGGEGSYLDNITITHNSDMWKTEADYTGSYVHIKNLDKSGTATLTLNMLSPVVAQLTKAFNRYYSDEYDNEPMTLTLSNAKSDIVVTCNSCYITRIPQVAFENEPGTRTWTFTCGAITISQ